MGSGTGSGLGLFSACFSSVFGSFSASIRVESEGGISLLFTEKSFGELSRASGGALVGSECAVFIGAGSVGSWGLVGEGFSSGDGFWVEFWSSGIDYIISCYFGIPIIY